MSRTGSKKSSAAERRARVATARQIAERAERRALRVRIGRYAGVAVAVVAVIIATTLYVSHRKSDTAALPHPAAATGAGLPPWPAPADPSAGIQRAGLRANAMEGTAEHFHTHLDIFVNGKRTQVPANLGINTQSGQLAELHTHDPTGVLHIEAPDTTHRYVLGQLFTEWGIRLDGAHVGGLTATPGKTLRAYVNGKQISGDPASIELTAHREITLTYGPANQRVQVPRSYSFPAGL